MDKLPKGGAIAIISSHIQRLFFIPTLEPMLTPTASSIIAS
ncbi:hypothetical protein [Microcoleus sp. FACHB-831]|nr:hypothetical protein [Microcoleus sp. FACHB-831]